MGRISINNSDVIWSYAGNILKLAINVIMLPIILHYLTDDELGLWYVFASIGQLAILFDFGFAPALSRNIAYVWCGADQLQRDSISQDKSGILNVEYFKLILKTSRHIYLFIAIITCSLMLLIGTPYIKSLISDKSVIYAWIIYSFGVFLNILYSYYTSFLRGVGAIAENNKAATFSKIFQLFLTFIFLYFGQGLLGVCIAYLISGIVIRVFSRHYFLKYDNIGRVVKNISIDNTWKKELGILKIIWHNASKEGLITISDYLSIQANTLICSSIFGLHSTGFYGLAIQIVTIIANISMIPFSSYQVALQEKAVLKDIEGSKKIFSTTFMAFIISFLILLIGSILILPIIKLLKDSMEIDYYMYAVIAVNIFIYHFFHLMASFISSYNILPYTKSFIISSLFSVCLSYILARYTSLGLLSLVLSPLCVSLVYNFWKWPTFVFNMLNCSASKFLKAGLLNTFYIIKTTLKINLN